MYFLQHQIADEMLMKATQWVRAFGKARAKADRAIQRLEGKLEAARTEEREVDEKSAKITGEWEAKIKAAVDELAAQRNRHANTDEELQVSGCACNFRVFTRSNSVHFCRASWTGCRSGWSDVPSSSKKTATRLSRG